jgi:type IV secretory pathway TrbL component
MSKKTKIIIWVIVVVVVLGVIWWMVKNSQNTSQPNMMNTAGAPANESSTENTIVSTGTSDSDLDQDMNNINAQMNGLSSDTANVDASMASSSQSGQ